MAPRCHLCDSEVPAAELLGHLRLLHPDVDTELNRWPDGEVVVKDSTAETVEDVLGDE